MMTRALDGDVGAARLLLERAIAPLKAVEQPRALSLPDGIVARVLQHPSVFPVVRDGPEQAFSTSCSP